ncbi:AP-5 complex subunit zeta-1-like isoform X2 [Limulus polyphemus]|uniref:AP-5 complex subunit zeta-1-like isoform X2 n=1 Tax=Limulus polyphemus TaxID=6850 RepID=A0ABM1BIU4_LIMPO|nr:AP-5 complex subunit zeta-1-like isoform X2 [Limulus polyphemus]
MAAMASSKRSSVSSLSSEFIWKEINIPKQLNKQVLRTLLKTISDKDVKSSDFLEDVEPVISSLIVFLWSETTRPLERHLAITILQKLAPHPSISEVVSTATVNQLIEVLPVLIAQTEDLEDYKRWLDKLIGYINTKEVSLQDQRRIQTFLTCAISMHPKLFHIEDIKTILQQAPCWLKEAAIVSARKTASSLKKSALPSAVTELDGVPSSEFFTVLSYAHYNTIDQLLNIQTFSMLRTWLLSVCRDHQGAVIEKHSCPHLGEVLSVEISGSIKDYCIRIVDQSDRNPQDPENVDIQKACLVEAVSLLDILCQADSSLVLSVVPTIRRIYDRLYAQGTTLVNLGNVSVLCSVVQFFLHHSSAIIHKLDDVYVFLFRDLLPHICKDSFTACEMVFLIENNLSQLCYQTSILEKFFPNILKILAWSPSLFQCHFIQILPAFLSQQTCIEVFHTLLDLPCLTVALILNFLSDYKGEHIEAQIAKYSMTSKDIDLYADPSFQPMFQFFLRTTSGVGDTFNRIGDFHDALCRNTTHPQVLYCAEAVIPLLSCFFDTFLQFADTSLVASLLPVLIERTLILYPVEGYIEKVQRMMSENVIKLISLHPDVLVHLQEEIGEFYSHIKNFSYSSEFFISLVWTIGEYVSQTYSGLCKPEIITTYYEGLEYVPYELVGSHELSVSHFRLMNITVTTLAKLGTRCQDLLPRVILCLSKVRKQLLLSKEEEEKYHKIRGIVVERISELLAILQIPNLSGFESIKGSGIWKVASGCDITPICFKDSLFDVRNI